MGSTRLCRGRKLVFTCTPMERWLKTAEKKRSVDACDFGDSEQDGRRRRGIHSATFIALSPHRSQSIAGGDAAERRFNCRSGFVNGDGRTAIKTISGRELSVAETNPCRTHFRCSHSSLSRMKVGSGVILLFGSDCARVCLPSPLPSAVAVACSVFRSHLLKPLQKKSSGKRVTVDAQAFPN